MMHVISRNKKLESVSVRLQERKVFKEFGQINGDFRKDEVFLDRIFLRLLLKMLIRDGKIERAKKIVKAFCLFM